MALNYWSYSESNHAVSILSIVDWVQTELEHETFYWSFYMTNLFAISIMFYINKYLL